VVVGRAGCCALIEVANARTINALIGKK
jgi:hypothetical protein